MSFELAASAWGLASALAVMALGGLSVVGGPARPRGALAFGLFAMLWGLQILVGNLATLPVGVGAARLLYLLLLPLVFVSTYFLVEFAAAQPKGRPGAWTALRVTAVAVAAAGALTLVVRPEALLVGIQPQAGGGIPRWGPLFLWLAVVPQFGAFGITLLALWRAKREAPTPRTEDRVTVLLIGLSLYVAFAAGNNLSFYATLAAGGSGVATLLAAVFLALTLLCLALATRSLALGHTGPLPERRREHLVALALLVPLGWGAAEGVLAHSIPLLDTVGLWRLAGMGVIAYGLARWRIWDLPQRTRRGAARAAGATLAAAGGAAAYGAGALALPAAGSVLAGLTVAGLAVVPGLRLAERFLGAHGPSTAPEVEQRRYGQRMDAFRAALEASLARGTLEEDRGFLDALRERFGVSEAEERLLLHYARQSVVVARPGKAHEAFERLRLLGEGGAGRTWLARDRTRERLVVLKEPLERWHREPALRDSVLREARTAMRVRHPQVVQVESVILEREAPVIVMEYVDGGTLADLLRARGTLPWREAVGLMAAALAGVSAIHAAGIIHRDLKPSNVLLSTDGSPKVADFGIAITPVADHTLLDAATSSRPGTLAYMAPEVRHGLTPGDRRSDVYACAAILHEMLHGAPPRPGLVSIPRADVPAGVAAALSRGLAERPEERYASARAFAEALRRELEP